MMIVTEFMEGGSLDTFLKVKWPTRVLVCIQFLKTIVVFILFKIPVLLSMKNCSILEKVRD